MEKSVDKPEEEKKEEPEKKSTKVNESEEITNDDEENWSQKTTRVIWDIKLYRIVIF